MAASTGMGATINVDDSGGTPVDISANVTNFQFATPRAVQDITGVSKYAMERKLLLADFSVTFSGTIDTATNTTHLVFEDIADADVARTTKIQPTSGATPYVNPEVLYTDYAFTRGNDGSLTYSAPGVLADGVVPTWTNA